MENELTRIPTESWNLVGLSGPEYKSYKVGPTCSAPGCNRLADHSHHLVRRSFLGGPFEWVRMDDGVEIGNLAALCYSHHNDVTQGRTDITYDEGVFYWEDGRPLSPQPPMHGIESDLGIGHVLAEGHVREKCPTCNRVMPRPKIDTPTEEKKIRVSWAVGVPVTARENGADTLDELLEAARDEMSKKGWEYGDANTAKFFVLSHALAMFVTNADSILSDS